GLPQGNPGLPRAAQAELHRPLEAQPDGGLLADGERGGEPRTLDAEQGDEAGQAVHVRPVDAEIRLWLAGAVQLRPDARIVGDQRAVRQAGPELADVGVESFRRLRLDPIVL